MQKNYMNRRIWIVLLLFVASASVIAKAQEPLTQRLNEIVQELTVDATLKARQLQQEAVDGRMPNEAESIGAYLREVRWSPYVVGAGLGMLSWLTFLLSNHPLGASTAYAKSSGMLEKAVVGDSVKEKEYYRKHTPAIDWEWMLVVGMLFGALLSAWLSDSLTLDWTPALWEAGFGDTPVQRVFVAILGGALLGFGSRWASGCTSGHGLSGTMQLVISSWVSAISFFVGGVVTAMLIYYVLA